MYQSPVLLPDGGEPGWTPLRLARAIGALILILTFAALLLGAQFTESTVNVPLILLLLGFTASLLGLDYAVSETGLTSR